MNAQSVVSFAVAAVITLIVTAIVLGLILAVPVMWLWNGCLVPAISGVHEITWLQAWGLMILSAILIKTNVSKKD